MRPGRIVSLVVGCLLLVPALALFLGGVVLGIGYAFGRDDDGYFSAGPDRLRTDTVAVTAGDIEFATDPGTPGWVFDVIDADVRLRAVGIDGDVFIGIARTRDIDAYLASVAHDEIVEFDDGDAVYERVSGGDEVGPPGEQTFWEESASGPGTQELVWEPAGGRWSAVLMNADGSPNVVADVEVGAKAGVLLPLIVVLVVVGLLGTAGAVALIVFGASGARRTSHPEGAVAPPAVAPITVPPPTVPPLSPPPPADPSSLPPPRV